MNYVTVYVNILLFIFLEKTIVCISMIQRNIEIEIKLLFDLKVKERGVPNLEIYCLSSFFYFPNYVMHTRTFV